MTLATATGTASNVSIAIQKADDIKKFAMLIATACLQKLHLEKDYFVAVRWYGAPCPMPFVEIGVTPKVKPVETHEFSVCLPAIHYLCDTKDERSELANYVFNLVKIGVNRWESK